MVSITLREAVQSLLRISAAVIVRNTGSKCPILVVLEADGVTDGTTV
jgi:hypothetical protein